MKITNATCVKPLGGQSYDKNQMMLKKYAKNQAKVKCSLAHSNDSLAQTRAAHKKLRSAMAKLKEAQKVKPLGTSLKELGGCIMGSGEKTFAQSMSDLGDSLTGYKQSEVIAATKMINQANQELARANAQVRAATAALA